MVFRDNFKNAEFVMRSHDGGLTWQDMSVVAKDCVHNYCEGQVIMLSTGQLACLMRDNSHNGYPSYLSFSYDQGHTWTPPQPMPFSGDRPFPGQMPDGRVLVTYRNQSGNAGTNAWLGDLFTGAGFQVFGTHYQDAFALEDGTAPHQEPTRRGDALHLDAPGELPQQHRPGSDAARGRARGQRHRHYQRRTDRSHAYVLRDQIWCSFQRGGQGPNPAHPTQPGVDARHAVDMTKEHRLSFKTLRGRLWVEVDGVPVIHWAVTQGFPLEPTMFGRTKQSQGEVWLRSLSYQTVNETEPDFSPGHGKRARGNFRTNTSLTTSWWSLPIRRKRERLPTKDIPRGCSCPMGKSTWSIIPTVAIPHRKAISTRRHSPWRISEPARPCNPCRDSCKNSVSAFQC